MAQTQEQTLTEAAHTLVVDRENPFFFDHPLDHVPGMLVLSGLLDLVRAGHPAPSVRAGRMDLSLSFDRFCEHDDDIVLRLHPLDVHEEGATGWDLGAQVESDPVCSGRVMLHEKSPTQLVGVLPPRRRASLPTAQLAHRARPENVFVGEAWWDEERLLGTARRAHEGHPLDGRTAEQLIEAARQFGTLIGHSGYEQPLDHKYVLRGLRADIPVDFPEGDVFLEWLPMPSDRSRFDIRVRVFRAAPQGVEEVGSVSFDTFIVSPRRYDALRSRSRMSKGQQA
ncbi:AfsA-related hotdog domain-containing protein [Streptomyces rubradiris]|uniref:AfsA-related hotdog domain-containing protein n=1 Tax=Streptomyces rubradiris TaxID=285531 RepID=UPI0033FFCA50